MNKGRTAIEILVVIAITVVTSAVALYSFPNFRQRVQVERAAREMAIKIRTAQQRTLSPKQARKPDGTLAIPRGFGIYLDASLTGNASYIFFADMDGNNFFNIAGGDVVVETVLLPTGVKVSELKISSGLTLGAANIVYTVPFSETKIYDSGGAPISGDSLQVKLSQGTDIIRFVTVRTTGLVTLGPAPQITEVADTTPPGGDDCPGISNIHLTYRWAWNDILGWIDFCGGTNGNVLVAPDKITGYATSSSVIAPGAGEGGATTFDSFGAMVLDCSTPPLPAVNYCGTVNHGVRNDGSGVLSGWAWLGGGPGSPEASYGWVSFNCSNRGTCASVPYQVTIDPTTGDFHGFAWNDILGWISFNSEETGSAIPYKVNTIWRPSSSQKIVNLKANGADGLTIPYDTSAVLTWTSQALTVTCTAASTPPNQCWNSPVSTSTQNFIPGTKCSNLTQTTTFNISCDSGAVSDFVTVNVLPQPSVNIKADGLEGGPPSGTRTDPIVISLNTSATLTWLTSTGTISCLASGNWSGSKTTNNNTVGQPTGPQSSATTTAYYLDCASSGGTTIRDWVKVQWSSGGPASPSVTTNAATSLTSSGATLNSTINPNNLSTSAWFRYHTTNPGTCSDTTWTGSTRVPAIGGTTLTGGTPQADSRAITGLTASTIYYFCAIANNTLGTTLGDVLSFTTLTVADITPPTQPTGLTATPISSSQINLSWTASTDPESPITNYKIYRCSGTGCTPTLFTTLGNVTSYSNTGLTASTLYRYQVSAINSVSLESVLSTCCASATTFVGPIGWWKFDGDASDSSGNGNNGTLVGGPVFTTGTVGTGALDFDGIDDLVNIGTPALLNNLSPMTISAWIYPRSRGEANAGAIVAKDTNLTSGNWFLRFDTVNTNALHFNKQGATNLVVKTNADTINLNQWQLVVLTWDGSITATNVHIYRDNGVELGYSTRTNGATLNSDAALPLGIGNRNNTGITFNGLIDDVRIYNRVLTPAEISAIYIEH